MVDETFTGSENLRCRGGWVDEIVPFAELQHLQRKLLNPGLDGRGLFIQEPDAGIDCSLALGKGEGGVILRQLTQDRFAFGRIGPTQRNVKDVVDACRLLADRQVVLEGAERDPLALGDRSEQQGTAHQDDEAGYVRLDFATGDAFHRPAAPTTASPCVVEGVADLHLEAPLVNRGKDALPQGVDRQNTRHHGKGDQENGLTALDGPHQAPEST